MNRTVDSIITSLMVKYNQLEQIIAHVYQDSAADHINIYFDMYSVYKSIYATGYTVLFTDTVDIAAGIINLCAHYRAFFRKFGVGTTFYLISGYNCSPINNQMVHNYNRAMVNRLANGKNSILKDHLNRNIKLLEILCPYLPDIHFINTQFETSVCMAGMIKRLPVNNSTNLIISRDSYPMQLVTELPNTAFLRPKKFFGNDESYILKNPDTVLDVEIFWRTFFADRNNKNYTASIAPCNVTLLSAVSSYPARSIESIIMVGTAIKKIFEIIGCINEKCTPDTFYEVHEKYLRKKNITKEMIVNRYHALDAMFQESTFYSSSGEWQTLSLDNKIDPNAVNAINNKYFRNNPLDLERL